MNQERYELVQKGFRTLHPAMVGYIAYQYSTLYRDKWWDRVLNCLNDQYDLPRVGTYEELTNSLDVANCLRLLDRSYFDVFAVHIDNKSFRSFVKELMGVRNVVSHIGQSDLEARYAERALDTMHLVCAYMDDDEAAKELDELYNRLRNMNADISSPKTPEEDLLYAYATQPTGSAAAAGSLLSKVGTDLVQKTALTRKITFNGKTVAYPVYRVRLDALYYNDRNDRIATWVARYKAENGNDALTGISQETYNKIIESFIVDSNPEALKKTENNIRVNGQREPGVALPDGRIVDGNRRYTCLRLIRAADPDQDWFETVIMDADLETDEKQIKRLELAIQHGEEKKVDYDLVDYAVGTYNDVVVNKLLTIAEYAEATNEKEADVRMRIECAGGICEFLAYLGLPGQFFIARDYQMYSLISEMQPALKALSDDDRKTLKTMAFTNTILHASVDQRAFIRDINKLVRDNFYQELFAQQAEICGRVKQAMSAVAIRSKKDADAFAAANGPLAGELQASLQTALHRYRSSKLKAKPAESVTKSIAELSGVDTHVLETLDSGEKQQVRAQISNLTNLLDTMKQSLGEPSESASTQTAAASVEGDGSTRQEEIAASAAEKTGSRIYLAETDTTGPLVFCITPGGIINGRTVTVKFMAAPMEGGSTGIQKHLQAYFAGDDNLTVSSVREFSAVAGSVTAVTFLFNSNLPATERCRLILKDDNCGEDEALQVVPFTVQMPDNS